VAIAEDTAELAGPQLDEFLIFNDTYVRHRGVFIVVPVPGRRVMMRRSSIDVALYDILVDVLE
jgi:hypothetical protein